MKTEWKTQKITNSKIFIGQYTVTCMLHRDCVKCLKYTAAST